MKQIKNECDDDLNDNVVCSDCHHSIYFHLEEYDNLNETDYRGRCCVIDCHCSIFEP